MRLLSPRGSQFTTTPDAGSGNAMTCRESDARLPLEFFCFFFFVDLGIGSWSAAWDSRVDVVLLSFDFIRSRMLLLLYDD
jgi:hypothetical protein